LNLNRHREFSLTDFFQNFWAYGGCTILAMIFAEKCGLQCFLVERKGGWPGKLSLLAGYGVLAGIAMGWLYHELFLAYHFAPRVPFRPQSMKTSYDIFILSLSAALTEEVVFRLLLFSAFLYILGYLFRPILLMNSGFSRRIPFIFSLVFSALLFGLIHGVFGFLFAFAAGIWLCFIFLRAGLEGAVLAHFLADFVFFKLTYLA
jgi:membrane protease YdiL (CAAX protease family)